jgi:outer membrane immunogenic protein
MGAFMRKLFLLGLSTFAAMMLGAPAQAADMPVKAPPPPVPVMYNWTGFYIGGHIGGAWVDRNGHDRFDGVNNCIDLVCFDDNGFGHNDGRLIAGGQVGFNYQVGQFVWGVEGQISAVASHNDDGDACGFFTGPVNGVVVHDHLFNCRNRGDWIATLAARLGMTFGATGNWLLYIKGGAAFADGRFGLQLRDNCPVTWSFCNDNFAFNNENNTRTGWMIGAGMEYGWSDNLSWKIEYNFMDFGHRNLHFDNVLTACECRLIHDLDFDRQISVVKVGLNYRFAPAPVAAPVAARY